MLTLAASDTIAGVAGAASEVTCTLFLMELNAGVETYLKDQQQLADAAATIYTVPASTQAFITSIHVVNNDLTNSNTFQLFAGGTAAANAITPVFIIPPNGSAIYEDGLGWKMHAANGGVMSSAGVGKVMLSDRSSVCLRESAQAAYGVTGINVTGLNMILPSAGVYVLDYYIVYQSSAAGTGISLGVNFTGNDDAHAGWMEFPGTGTTASTGAASMVASGSTGQVHESFGYRANSTTSPNMGTTVSVDAAGSFMLTRICGLLKATTAGRLELWYAAEAAGLMTIIQTGSTLRIHRTN